MGNPVNIAKWSEMSDDLKLIEMMADGFDHVDSQIQSINDDIQEIRDSLSSLEDLVGNTKDLKNNKNIIDTLNMIVEMLETTQANVSASQQK